MAITTKQQSGMSLVGILIATAIITTGLIYLLGIINFSFRAILEKEDFYKAGFLAQEEIEAARNFRDLTDWSIDGLGTVNLTVPYHFVQQGPPLQWLLVGGNETIGKFTREVVFYEVRRDLDGNIISSGGGVDLNSKRAKTTISWQGETEVRSVTLESYFTNWQ